MLKTKIICTLGPATDDEVVLRALMRDGMNVARINFSHGTHDEQTIRIKTFKRVRAEFAFPVALMLDTKGPEIRIGTFKDGETAVTLQFHFNENGLIDSVRAEARGRTVAGALIPTPWEGRWRNYQRRDGMCIPTEGEVAWILAEGPKTYWRGRITSLRYEFAR